MLINFRQLALSLAGVALAGLGAPALAVTSDTLSNLILAPTNSLVVGNEFTFSNFLIDVSDTGNEAAWNAYTVTADINGSGYPFLAFVPDSVLAGDPPVSTPVPLTSGLYVVQYKVEYTGLNPPLVFTNYDLLVRDDPVGAFGLDTCYDFDGVNKTEASCTTLSYLYSADPGFSDPPSDPFIFPSGEVGAVSGGGSGTTLISKDEGGTNPVWVRTTIDVTGDEFTNFNNTFSTATAVPWETDVLPLVAATVLFGGGVWLKRRRSQISDDR